MKSFSAVALGLGLALAPASAIFAQDDTLVIGRSASTNALDPGFLREAATIVDNIFDTMVMRDEDMKLVPGLATAGPPSTTPPGNSPCARA